MCGEKMEMCRFLSHVLIPLCALSWAVSSSCSKVSIFDTPSCDFVLEVMYMQDLSDSFSDDVPQLSQQLPLIFGNISESWPGTSYGTATFVDKPLEPFGFPPQGNWFAGDWCLNVTTTISETDPLMVSNMLAGSIGGGNDWKENQLGVIHDIAKNSTLAGWSEATHDGEGKPVIRVIVLSTDAAYHIAGDGATSSWNLAANNGDGYTDCTAEDYPTIAQVRSALIDRSIYTVFLLGNNTSEDLLSVYNELLTALGTPGAAYAISADSSDIIDEMTVAINTLAEETCTTPTVDVVLSQDVTWSYVNDVAHLHEKLTNFTATVESRYITPRFGLTTFGDKPMMPLGHAASGDYCYRLEQDLSYNSTDIIEAAKTIRMTSGRDWKESQLDGMLSSVVDPNVSWRTGNTWNGFPLYRIAAVATDSGYHLKPDATTAGYNMASHNGGVVNCTYEEYPDTHQLALGLLAMDVAPLFIPTSDIAFIYRKLVNDLRNTYGIVGGVVELKDFEDLSTVLQIGVTQIVYELAAARLGKSFQPKPL